MSKHRPRRRANWRHLAPSTIATAPAALGADDMPEVTLAVAEQVWRHSGARLYWGKDWLLRDDLHGWLILEAVEAGRAFRPDPWARNPAAQYAAFLRAHLTRAARRHFTNVIGDARNPSGAAAVTAYARGVSLDHLDEVEADGGYRVARHPLHASAIDYLDPAVIFERVEHLEREINEMEHERSARGSVFTTESPTCGEPTCHKPPEVSGLCRVHYNRQRELWAAEDGRPLCNVPDCGRAHAARGLCKSHYSRHSNGTLPEDLLRYVEEKPRKRGRKAADE